jgi:hypothetical protein
MASNRSNAPSRSTQTPKQALVAVARHGARIQIATLGAGGKAIAGWANAADKLAQAFGDALLRRVNGETDSRELIVHVATATNVHLHELAALPSMATDHFNTRLARVPTKH